MKKYPYIILIVLIAYCPHHGLWAQVDRSKAPEPGPAPEITLGKYSTFKMGNGLRVFLVENHKLPKVSFSLVLDHDPVVEGKKAGYVDMAGDLLRTGTETRTKEQLDEQIDFIGASLSTSSTGIYASSLTKHMDTLLTLMTDILYHPSFPHSELTKLKKQLTSSIVQARDDPKAIAGRVRSTLLYGKGNPYGELVTEETVEKVILEDCKSYYERYFVPNNAYLVIVGDIDKKKAQKVVKQYFADWAKKEFTEKRYPFVAPPGKRQVAFVDRPASVQSVINITYPVILRPGSEDVIKARVMNQILGGGFSSRLMQNLREDKAYTYSVGSSLSPDKLRSRFLISASVRNEVTDSAVHEFLKELKRITEHKVVEKELRAAKAVITGSFARSLENPGTIARFALNIEKYGLPKDYYAQYLKKVSEVTVEDVQEMAKKYIAPGNAYVLVVGKGEEVKEKLGRFGPVSVYDGEGNTEGGFIPEVLSEGPTAAQVLERYIMAIGGKGAVTKVRNLSLKYAAKTQEMDLKITRVQQYPDKFKEVIALGLREIHSTTYNGGKAKMIVQGNEIPMTVVQVAEAKYKSIIFPEVEYEKMGFEVEMRGIKKIGKSEVYELAVTSPIGATEVLYFDKDTGLKLKSETQQASITYGDYRIVEGVRVPHQLSITSPMGKMEAELENAEINVSLPASTFRVD